MRFPMVHEVALTHVRIESVRWSPAGQSISVGSTNANLYLLSGGACKVLADVKLGSQVQTKDEHAFKC